MTCPYCAPSQDFPYTSYAAPLDGDCEQWALVSESHDCETGAHSGLWAGLRLGGGGDGAPTGGNTSASAPLVIAAFKVRLVTHPYRDS